MVSSTLAQGSCNSSSIRSDSGLAERLWQRWPDALAIGSLVAVMSLTLSSRFDHAAVLHDMGTLGHAAERVLLGELPHADFDDPYTGLLSLWNALAFHFFGISVLSARVPLLICGTAAFAALYGFCRRTLSPWAATAVVAAAFAASLPNYFTPMPTWYNLFATIAAAAALLRFAATERQRWLLVAGACAAVSFLFKSVGLYTVAAAALFAVFHEQERSEAQHAKPLPSSRASWVILAGLWLYAVCVLRLVASHPALPEFVTFLAPSLVTVVFLSCNELRLRHQGAGERLRRLVVGGAIFCGGFAAVIGAFLVPYFFAGKVFTWYRGVFVRPLVRLEDEMMGRPLDLEPFLGGAFLMVLAAIGIALVHRERRTGRAVAVTAALIFAVLLSAAREPAVYAALWSFARLIPLAASIGISLLLWSRHRTGGKKRQARCDRPIVDEGVFLLVTAATVFSLVQIPLAHGIYFLYAVPLIIVGAAMALKAHFQGEGAVGLLASAVGLFAVCWMIPGHFSLFGSKYAPSSDTAHFVGTRCPTTSDPITVQQYAEMVQEVRGRTAKDEPIWAFPDSPDVYFMTGRRNVTRTFFDALDADYGTPARESRLIEAIEKNKINVVVIRHLVEFSHEAVSQSLLDEIRRRFPHAKEINGGVFPRFTIFWRDRSPQLRPAAAVAGK